jgi:2-amino-4-hydroxy-6-hydroxymethyldihydropteridine diphosphokinase
VALGSNLGDRNAFVSQALKAMEQKGLRLLQTAPLYETQPIGAADQVFINTAARIETQLSAENVMTVLLTIERELGRTRDVHWGNRTIDLDLIVGIDATGQPITCDSKHLQLPHPRFLERDFVLVPAADVAPSWIHPDSGQKLEQERVSRGWTLTRKQFP